MRFRRPLCIFLRCQARIVAVLFPCEVCLHGFRLFGLRWGYGLVFTGLVGWVVSLFVGSEAVGRYSGGGNQAGFVIYRRDIGTA